MKSLFYDHRELDHEAGSLRVGRLKNAKQTKLEAGNYLITTSLDARILIKVIILNNVINPIAFNKLFDELEQCREQSDESILIIEDYRNFFLHSRPFWINMFLQQSSGTRVLLASFPHVTANLILDIYGYYI